MVAWKFHHNHARQIRFLRLGRTSLLHVRFTNGGRSIPLAFVTDQLAQVSHESKSEAMSRMLDKHPACLHALSIFLAPACISNLDDQTRADYTDISLCVD